jgi:hypothetical protein
MRDIETRLRKMSAVDIVDYSIEVYKRNIKKLTVLTLIMYVPFALLYVFLSGYISKDLNRLTAGNGESFSLIIAFMLVSLGLLFVYLCYFLTINGVLQAAITKVVYGDVVYGKSLGLKEVIRDSFKKIFKILGYRVLFYLIMSGAIMGIFFVFYLFLWAVLLFFGTGAAFFSGGGRFTEGILIFSGVVIIIVLILGVLLGLGFFYIKFGMGVQAIAVENKGATEGIARSADLTKKMFWNSFVALFTGGLIYVFIPSVSVGITVILSLADNELYRQVQLAATAFIQLGYAIFYPFLATLTTNIFINCKINNEGLDLEVKVDKLLASE